MRCVGGGTGGGSQGAVCRRQVGGKQVKWVNRCSRVSFITYKASSNEMCRWHWRRFPGGAPTPIHYLATTSSISIIAGSRRWDMTRVANTDFQTHTNTGTNTDVNTDTKTDWYTDQNGWFFGKVSNGLGPRESLFRRYFVILLPCLPLPNKLLPSAILCRSNESWMAWHPVGRAIRAFHTGKK